MRRTMSFAAVAGVALAVAAGAQARTIPGQYIVVLDDDVRAANVATAHARLGARVLDVYGAALKGYAARLTPSQLAAVRSTGRLDRGRPDRLRAPDADQSALGPRPHRPALAPARRDLHVLQDRRGREG